MISIGGHGKGPIAALNNSWVGNGAKGDSDRRSSCYSGYLICSNPIITHSYCLEGSVHSTSHGVDHRVVSDIAGGEASGEGNRGGVGQQKGTPLGHTVDRCVVNGVVSCCSNFVRGLRKA